MKKILFIIPLVLIMIVISRVPAKAATPTTYGYVIAHDSIGERYLVRLYYYVFNSWSYNSPSDLNSEYANVFTYCEMVRGGTYSTYSECEDFITDWLYNHPVESYNIDSENSVSFFRGEGYSQYIFNVPYRYVPSDVNIVQPPEPPEPEPVNSWFKDIWDFIMDTLSITDDFSNDLYDWIFEGDDGNGGHSGGHSFEYVTPTPSPTPTPAPTPTPYTLDIVDNNGNPVYTITGIPNQTITINNTTNNENGDDFDIFEVDVKLLPSGGVSNPKDGLNSVMESNLEVLEDIDITPVGASFSVLPSDWFIMLGAIICMPFIAGFISKLLK